MTFPKSKLLLIFCLVSIFALFYYLTYEPKKEEKIEFTPPETKRKVNFNPQVETNTGSFRGLKA